MAEQFDVVLRHDQDVCISGLHLVFRKVLGGHVSEILWLKMQAWHLDVWLVGGKALAYCCERLLG